MTEPRLFNPRRERLILDLLRRETALSVLQLSRELGVSEATIRRDLQGMHDRKLLQRVRGGATLPSALRSEPFFRDKQSLQSDAKRRIATAALALIEDGDQIYLDGGSTVLMLASLLGARRDLMVVTNSLMAASALIESEHRLILVGGEFRAISRTLVGPLTASITQALHVDKAFMGTIGFTVLDGMTTTDPGEAFTKEQIMKRANQVILLADSSKLGIPSFARSGTAEDVDILITEKITARFRGDLEALGTEIIIAAEDGDGSGHQFS